MVFPFHEYARMHMPAHTCILPYMSLPANTTRRSVLRVSTSTKLVACGTVQYVLIYRLFVISCPPTLIDADYRSACIYIALPILPPSEIPPP